LIEIDAYEGCVAKIGAMKRGLEKIATVDAGQDRMQI